MYCSSEFLSKGDRVLVIDAFLSSGCEIARFRFVTPCLYTVNMLANMFTV